MLLVLFPMYYSDVVMMHDELDDTIVIHKYISPYNIQSGITAQNSQPYRKTKKSQLIS